jgi:subtilisin family serine protease
MPRLTRTHLVRALSAAALALVVLAPAATSSRGGEDGTDRWAVAPSPTAVVGYDSRTALQQALRLHPGIVLRTIPALGVAEILPNARPRYFASATADLPGIEYVEPPVVREEHVDPALLPSSTSLPGGVLEWQYLAARVDAVPSSVLRAASAITIAVVDTGADVTEPDIAAKSPVTYSIVSGSTDVRDSVGHGTFVAALAAGSVTNDDGIAGFGGDAKLMIVQASRTQGAFSDFDEAAAIVWAVDHGARILNLSLGGPDTSTTERRAIDYAVTHGALIVTAIGNEHDESNPVEYPAALVQPVGSNGRGGVGLSVGASDETGARAGFSNTGSHLSLLAPGVNVLSALSSKGSNVGYVKVALPGATAGLYAFSSGTSFAAPEVAGAAALVWAANPLLTAQQVAGVLKRTASNRGSWNGELGYGVIDAAAAVEQASNERAAAPVVASHPARASLSLTATPVRGTAPLNVSVRAALFPEGRAVPAGGRRITLQAFSGGRWRAEASGRTKALGQAAWSFVLDAGLYRLRARFAGTADLGPALSRTISVRVS